MPGKKLLVADDSLTIQKVIRLALSNEGYEIQAVSDGNDAIQQVSLFNPDVVLIDVSLPGKSAFEVKREINQHLDFEEIRFVLMSSAFEKVDEVQSNEVRFHGQLTKPFDPAHLRQVLHQVLDQVSAKRAEKTTLLQSSTPSINTSVNSPINSLEKLSIFPPPPIDSTDSPPPESFSSVPPPPTSLRDMLLPDNWEQPISDEPSFKKEPPHWENPVTADFPTFPNPPPTEPLENLWEAGQDPSIPGFTHEISSHLQSPPPPPPKKTEITTETDIQELTESTMRISSMDDYQWSVNDPMMKPMSKMLDRSGSNFDLGMEEAAPIYPPTLPKNEMESPKNFSGNFPGTLPGGTKEASQHDLPEELPERLDEELMHQQSSSFNLEKAYAPLPPHMSRPPSIQHDSNGFSQMQQEKIEELIRSEVKAALEKMTQGILAPLAEKIIKDEIHRMLSE